GQDLPGRPDLADLVEQVLQVPGLRRLRLSSIEPNEVGEKLMRLMQQYPNFCRHLHIPLQAGQDR
ncbi:MAG TPA: tRNA (N(6)-L-threonylcarbamoyladenosine(37)-C(2))-methylthiotransferase MtaB, partial [Firmicutes bacterium]|nr:tRNA (N(6)-L-threonylcarbamoyladenosine(37)-C(2))-methylthiotransferase MtaB [Bacillota bacterium]